MKISIPLIDIKDQLLILLSEGFDVLGYSFMWSHDVNAITMREEQWRNKVYKYLYDTFPTAKEVGQFLHTPGPMLGFVTDERVNTVRNMMNIRLKVLEIILDTLEKYYQFEPETLRLYIQQIDSFSKVRGTNLDQVKGFVENGYFKGEKEISIKRWFAEIVDESFVPNDHGGETEDLYTSRFLLNGQRVQTSVVLNGPGKVRDPETRTKDLGKQGDQLERMMRTDSSKLYILQSVKPVGQDIVNTFEVFIKDQRSKKNHCYYCIIDGQDTAIILYAYGYLREIATPTL